jgi:hypothetical protein
MVREEADEGVGSRPGASSTPGSWPQAAWVIASHNYEGLAHRLL